MRMWRMTSSAPVAPASATAPSKAHSAAVEKSVGMRMRRQGYMTLLRWNRRCPDRLGSDDVSNHCPRLRLRLRHLQRDLLVAGFDRVAGDERVLHGLVQVYFEGAPVLLRRIGRLGGVGAELREVRGVVVVDLRVRVVGGERVDLGLRTVLAADHHGVAAREVLA